MLRGVAAAAVLLHHAQGFFRRNGPTLFDGEASDLVAAGSSPEAIAYWLGGLGYLGVALFFVVSGFCIHLPFARAGSGSERVLEPRRFFVRRILRLYPTYLVVCLVGFVLVGAAEGFGSGRSTWSNFLGHLVFWHYGWPPGERGLEITVVLWSIFVEVQFYVIYAVTLPVLRRVGLWRVTAALLVIDVGYRVLWAVNVGDGAVAPQILDPHRFGPTRYGEWLLGACLAEYYLALRRDPALGVRWYTRTGSLLGCVAIAVCSVSAVAWIGGSESWLDVPFTLAFTLLVVGLLAREVSGRWNHAHWVGRVLEYCGSRSYSLYLIHYLVLGSVGWLAARALGIVDRDAMGGTAMWAGVTGCGIVAALVASEVLFRTVERPTHGLARRASERIPPGSREGYEAEAPRGRP